MPDIHCEECKAWSMAYDQIQDAGKKLLNVIEVKTQEIFALQGLIRKLTNEIMAQAVEIEKLRHSPPNSLIRPKDSV